MFTCLYDCNRMTARDEGNDGGGGGVEKGSGACEAKRVD